MTSPFDMSMDSVSARVWSSTPSKKSAISSCSSSAALVTSGVTPLHVAYPAPNHSASLETPNGMFSVGTLFAGTMQDIWSTSTNVATVAVPSTSQEMAALFANPYPMTVVLSYPCVEIFPYSTSSNVAVGLFGRVRGTCAVSRDVP